MDTCLYFVRHGEVNNPNDIFYGRLPGYALSELGRKQVLETAEYLVPQHIKRIYTSKLLRAKQSAQIIQQKLNLSEIHFSSGISEITTSFQGQSFSAVRERNYDVFASPDNGITGETTGEILQRMRKFVSKITKTQRGEHIVVVSHGDPIMLLRAWIEGLPIVNESIRPVDGSYIALGEVYLVQCRDNEPLHLESVFKPR